MDALERAFAVARLDANLPSDAHGAGTVDAGRRFHEAEKLRLMASDAGAPARLGRLVETMADPIALQQYRQGFIDAMQHRGRRGRHANALRHAVGFLSLEPDGARRALGRIVDRFEGGAASLNDVRRALREACAGDPRAHWLRRQTYLDPFRS